VLVLVRRLSLGQVHAVHLVLDELDVVLHHRLTDSASPIHFFRILEHEWGGMRCRASRCFLSLQETAKSTRAKTLVNKDQALVDSLSTRVSPYLRGF
jgi:hypothetical protein